MKTVRQRITLIQNLVEKKLPDSEDLFEYPGISRELILQSLTESYEYSHSLDKYEGKLEVVVLKRNISSLYEDVNNFFKNDLDGKEVKKQFDRFLNDITKIRYLLKEAYVLLEKEPFRAEQEIRKSKVQLESLQLSLEELKNVYGDISEIKNRSTEFVSQLQTSISETNRQIGKITDFAAGIENISEKVDEQEKTIVAISETIEEKAAAIAASEKNATTLLGVAEKVSAINGLNATTLSGLKDSFEEQIKANLAFQDQISSTIEDANRYGMAGSFRNRKEELKWSMRLWTGLSVSVLVGLFIMTFYIFAPLLNGQFDFTSYIVKLPIFASALWLGWFCTKQYGFTARLLEDYSFKYAISMAFEGYKKEAKIIDEDVLRKLIELTILNVSMNPVMNFNSKSNHATPYHEIFESFMKKVDIKANVGG